MPRRRCTFPFGPYRRARPCALGVRQWTGRPLAVRHHRQSRPTHTHTQASRHTQVVWMDAFGISCTRRLLEVSVSVMHAHTVCVCVYARTEVDKVNDILRRYSVEGLCHALSRLTRKKSSHRKNSFVLSMAVLSHVPSPYRNHCRTRAPKPLRRLPSRTKLSQLFLSRL